MPPDESTRVNTGGKGVPPETRPLRAVLFIERRMGRQVEGEKINLLFGPQMLIGRDLSSDIMIDDDRVSRKHAVVRIEDDAARLSDLGSTNGTSRNGEDLADEIILESGDALCFGKARTFEVRVVEREGVITSVRLASGADAYLLVPQEIVIGFADPDDETVDLKIYDPEILPRHARIEFFAGQTFVVSHDPAKQVLVNSKPVREMEIRNNYLIEIGDTLLRFERSD